MRGTVIAVLVLGLASLSAPAATISYSIVYETTFTNDASCSTSATGADRYDMIFNSGLYPAGYDTHWVNRLAIYYTASGLAAGEDVNVAGFGITMSGGFSLSTKYASVQWRAYNPQVTITDPTSPPDQKTAALYTTNEDAGAANDLRGILAITSAAMAWGLEQQDPPAGPEIAPQKLGWIFVKWDGGSAGITAFGDPPTGSSWSKYADNDAGLSSTIVSITGGTVSGHLDIISDLPEPCALSLLALGCLGLVRRRGRLSG